MLANGTEQNIFYKKATGNSVFEEIPAGDVLVSWNGEFGFDNHSEKRKECAGMDLIKTAGTEDLQESLTEARLI